MIKCPSNNPDDVGKVDSRPATIARWNFSMAISDLPQHEKAEHIEQVFIDLMDWTEQSEDEELWCRIYDEFQRIYHEIDCR